MPYQSNLERNAVIYQHWQEGKTIEEISTLTGVPRSTVGYYVRKFNAAARAGMPLPLPPPSKKQPAEIVFSFLTKAKVMEFVLNLLKTGDAQTIYYNLASMKLLTELIGRLTLTKEERELLSSAMTAAKPAQPTVQKQGPKLAELFPDSTVLS
jgi:transposase